MNFSSEHLWYLVSVKLSGEATPEELTELDALLKTHPAAHFQMEILEKIWRRRNMPSGINVQDAYNKHLQRLSNHLSEPVLQYQTMPDAEPETEVLPQIKSNKRIWWMSGAAAAVLLLLASLLFQNSPEQRGAIIKNEVSTRHGSKSKIQLPDGSVVWLNSGSKLTYDKDFGGSLREVHLSGEAYFDVVKDEARPFVIHTAHINVKVLGTAFNVRAYPDEQATETALIRGSVEVKVLNNPDKNIVLKPSEKLVVQHREDTVQIPQRQHQKTESIPIISIVKVHTSDIDSAVVETLWVENKLAFDNETLEVIARKLERWYDVKVRIDSEDLKQTTYTATFETETLDEVMAALKYTGKFDYDINRKEVLIGSGRKRAAF